MPLLPFSLGCCEGLSNVDYSKVDLSVMMLAADYVDLTNPRLVVAALCIALNPLFWNLVARWEHRSRSLTRVFRSPYVACYCLGAVIMLLNFLRSHCFTEAMKSQPKLKLLDSLVGYYIGVAFAAVGAVFVVSSFLALGFVGTFLGDYFGILMEAKVTCFPFNVSDNPMYWGSTIIYLGWSIIIALVLDLYAASLLTAAAAVLIARSYPASSRHASLAGVLLTAVVALCYMIALRYEGPFTEEIYRQKASKRL